MAARGRAPRHTLQHPRSSGELVAAPLPSVPLAFWNDPDRARYRDAYLNTYPGVWRHGDLVELTRESGVIVYGRSDAVLNPGGVRIGTAEVYRPLETVPAVAEALAVGKREGSDEVIWLFVVLREGMTLDDALTEEIRGAIRRGSSPRHVPIAGIIWAAPHSVEGAVS